MIYLAGPYSHPDPAVREARYRAVSRQAAEMLGRGTLVFSPIVYGRVLANYGLPSGWDFWKPFDHAILETCSEVWVLMLPGWEESHGIQAEIDLAMEMGKPVMFVLETTDADDRDADHFAGNVEGEVRT